MAEVRLICNLKGILYYLDTPLLDFEIRNRELIKADDLSGGRFFPPELAIYGVTYGNINEFFERRTMKEGCMYYREHLKNIGMEKFDFDRYIIKNNGNNNLDNYWVKFDGFGAGCFAELLP
ncbi:MAG: hypothetical protein K5888_11025 [Lachnospiraceae bacterium]|nr:hypothetical protein [Lachnospiraceae bacterium]